MPARPCGPASHRPVAGRQPVSRSWRTVGRLPAARRPRSRPPRRPFFFRRSSSRERHAAAELLEVDVARDGVAEVEAVHVGLVEVDAAKRAAVARLETRVLERGEGAAAQIGRALRKHSEIESFAEVGLQHVHGRACDAVRVAWRCKLRLEWAEVKAVEARATEVGRATAREAAAARCDG